MTPRPLTSDVPEDPETMIAENDKNNTLRETDSENTIATNTAFNSNCPILLNFAM